jgi:hypothetical protein
MGISFARKFPTGAVLNLAIAVLSVVVLYLGYSFVLRMTVAPSLDPVRDGDPRGRPIQVDVINGSGAAKIGSHYTQYLRSRGYDVVEIRTYHRSDIAQSIVVARTSNPKNAEKVATALGIEPVRIIQEVSPEYYVDVSVLIGKDFPSLKPPQ